MASDRYLKQKINLLKKEVDHIQKQFYPDGGTDLAQEAFNWQMKRDHLLRGIILELHLSIENLLEDFIKAYFAKHHPRSRRGKIDRRSVSAARIEGLFTGEYRIDFRDKLALARLIGAVKPRMFQDLEKLNQLRNRAGHIWLLSSVRRRNVPRKKRKRPFLEFDGKNLYHKGVIDEFLGGYGRIYLRLLMKLWSNK